MRAVRIVTAAMMASAVVAGCTSAVVSRPAAVVRPASMPRYYVTMADATAVVRNSASGSQTGSVRLPVTIYRGEDVTSLTVSAAADDRHFVIEVSNGGDLPGVSEAVFYTLSVSPAGRPGKPARVNFSSHGVPVTGATLSPDGTMLALSLMHEPVLVKAAYGDVEVIDLRTGAARTWNGQGAPGYWPGVPFWSGNQALDVPWWHATSSSTLTAAVTGIRQLDASAPGGSLLGTRLIAFPAAARGLESAMITSGGAQLAAATCSAGPSHTATARVEELSAVDGHVIRILHSQTATFRNAVDAQDAATGPCAVLSADASGHYILVQAFAFGEIANGAFSALPSPAPAGLYVSAAW